MSKDVYNIFETMNRDELKTKVALQCSPLLTGIKISNLLIVDLATREEVENLFKDTVISYYVLYQSEEKITFFMYRKEALLEYLHMEKVENVMNKFGYKADDLEKIFYEVSRQYTAYMMKKGDFPHELGLLLGYPVEDVVGFIENEGKNFLYSGYWKVYSNLSEALELFTRYNEAKEAVIRLVSKGENVHSILDRYYRNIYCANQFAM